MKKALDLFCGAGGATKGLQRAGFHVTGVDINPQGNYCGDVFYRGDAIDFPLASFDFVWASPPCQRYTRMNKGLLQSQGRHKDHPDLIDVIRRRLEQADVLYTIENVVGAPLRNASLLCGSSFGLMVERHRIFESNFSFLVPECHHANQTVDKPPLHRLYGRSRVVGCYGHGRGKGDTVALWKEAMGIDWMTRRELAEAIPPAYSEFIGHHAISALLVADCVRRRL